MARNPSYLIASVAILATSIAAQIAITSVVDAMLMRPPTGGSVSRLALVCSSEPGDLVSYPDYQSLKERSRSFSSMFAFERTSKIGFSAGNDYSLASYSLVSGSYFPAIGVSAADGRVLFPEDDEKGAPPVAVVSDSLSRKFRLKVGSVVKINTAEFEVVGILPGNFEGIEKNSRTEIWIPFSQIGAIHSAWYLTNRNWQWIIVGGCLGPGVAFPQAAAEMRAIGAQLQREFPVSDEGQDLLLKPVLNFRLDEDQSSHAMLLLFGLGWFLFALALANFFALTLVRLFNRRRELSIRLCLGASRADVGRWLLGELAVVACLSLASGYGISLLLLAALRMNPHFADLMDRAGIHIDLRSVGVVVASTVVGILVVWLVALRGIQRTDLSSAIRETATAPKRQRTLAALFAIQFGIVLFLLTSASSLVDTLRDATRRHYPFRTENLLFMNIDMRAAGRGSNWSDSQSYLRALLDRIETVPGVKDVAAGTCTPLGGTGYTSIIIGGKDPALEADHNDAHWAFVSQDFFETLGLPIVSGRPIDRHDVQQNAKVVVIDRAAADRFWPGSEALGKTFQPWTGGVQLVVIGVAENLPARNESKPIPRIYLPSSMSDGSFYTLDIAVQGDSAAVRKRLQSSLGGLWPYHNTPELRSIQDQIRGSRDDLAATVQITLWVTGFATFITTFGFYFFSAYTVSRTLKDAAVRMALGASMSEVLKVHLYRFRWGVVGGLSLGALLFWSGATLGRHVSVIVAVGGMDSLAAAASLMVVIAGVGLCLPLRRVAGMNSYHLLRSDVE